MKIQTTIYHYAIFASISLMIVLSPACFAQKEEGIDAFRTTIEQMESGALNRLSQEEFTQTIDRIRRGLDSYLEEHQQDVEVLILTARLGLIEELARPIMISKGKLPDDSRDLFIAEHANLDLALQLQPGNAEANYWKARLYGIQPSGIDKAGRLVKTFLDLDKAILFSKKAVQLDPDNVTYREALAIYLIENQNRKEALEVMETPATEGHPINVLLKDTDAFPLPEGTIYSREDSVSYGEMQMTRQRITNYPQLRVQVFIVPLDAGHVEQFYKQRWNKFKFFTEGRGNPLAEYVSYSENGFLPATSMSEVVQAAGKDDGFLLSLLEVSEATEEQSKETPAGHLLPFNPGDNFCFLIYVNYRHIN